MRPVQIGPRHRDLDPAPVAFGLRPRAAARVKRCRVIARDRQAVVRGRGERRQQRLPPGGIIGPGPDACRSRVSRYQSAIASSSTAAAASDCTKAAALRLPPRTARCRSARRPSDSDQRPHGAGWRGQAAIERHSGTRISTTWPVSGLPCISPQICATVHSQTGKPVLAARLFPSGNRCRRNGSIRPNMRGISRRSAIFCRLRVVLTVGRAICAWASNSTCAIRIGHLGMKWHRELRQGGRRQHGTGVRMTDNRTRRRHAAWPSWCVRGDGGGSGPHLLQCVRPAERRWRHPPHPHVFGPHRRKHRHDLLDRRRVHSRKSSRKSTTSCATGGPTTPIKMDMRTIDIMAASHRLMDVSEPYMLLSGYRSPKTNAMLRSKSGGVAQELAAHEGPGGRPAAEVAVGRPDGQGRCGLLVGRCGQVFAVELRAHGLRPGPQLGRLTPVDSCENRAPSGAFFIRILRDRRRTSSPADQPPVVALPFAAVDLTAAEPHRHDELLGTVGPARRRLHVRDLGEVASSASSASRSRPRRPAPWRRRCRRLPARRRQRPAPPRPAPRCAGGRSPLCPRGRRRHVGHHHIGPPAKPALDLVIGVVVQKIQLVDLGPGNRLHLLQVDAQHRADRLFRVLPQRIDPRHRHLAPAARRAAKIDHPRPRLQEPVRVIQFQNLVGRPAPVAFALGADARKGRSAAAPATASTTACAPSRS